MANTDINSTVISQFRAGGEITGMHRDRLLLLTTTGAKTGAQRTTPMMFHREGEELMVIASAAGAPQHPGWLHNLRAHPDVTVEIGEETYPAIATELDGQRLDDAWETIIRLYPFFAEHQSKISRRIPVVALERRPG